MNIREYSSASLPTTDRQRHPALTAVQRFHRTYIRYTLSAVTTHLTSQWMAFVVRFKVRRFGPSIISNTDVCCPGTCEIQGQGSAAVPSTPQRPGRVCVCSTYGTLLQWLRFTCIQNAQLLPCSCRVPAEKHLLPGCSTRSCDCRAGQCARSAFGRMSSRRDRWPRTGGRCRVATATTAAFHNLKPGAGL